MLSDDGRSKCMDAKADGYCRSEAVVSVLLQRRSVAKRIYATVLNARTNNDGYKPEGITFPSMAAQRKLMKETYAEAGVDPLDIKYMEAHMTGTPAGDPVESQAIVEALCVNRTDPLLMGCLKSNMGHTEGASGMCAISKACLVFQRREIPPNLHLVTPNPSIDGLKTGVLKPVLERTEFHDDLIGVNSFGFGGCNVHAVLKANEKVETEVSYDIAPDIPRLIIYAGRTNESVNYLFDNLDSHPKKITREFLALVNETAKIDPEQGLIHRGYVILDSKKKGMKRKVTAVQEKRPVWFVFPSLGTSWPHCVTGLMEIPTFEESIKMSGLYLFPFGIDLIDLLFDPNQQLTTFTESLLVIVAVQIALVDLLKFLKVTPEGIVGHSLGEIAAGYADGSLDAEEALNIAYHVANAVEEYQKSVGRSTMGLIGLGQSNIEKRLPAGIEIACINSSDSVTVAGPVNSVRKFLDELESEGIVAREIESHGVALHSKTLEAVKEKLTKSLSSVLRQSKVRSSKWLSASTLTESWEEQAARSLNASYFVNILTSQVALPTVFDHIPKNSLLIEIAPASVLIPFLRRGLGADVSFTSLMKRDSLENINVLLSGLGDIHSSGNNVALEKLYPKVEWPVPRETASLSSLIKWNHTRDWATPSYPDHFNLLKGNQGFSIDVMEVRYQYLTGHCIDGRVLFPATGYLWIIWERAAVLSGYNGFADVSVEFRDVKLYRATMLAKTGLTSFKLVVIPETGQFAVVEGGTICVTGHVRLLKTPEDEDTTEYERMVQPPFNPDAIRIQTKEIYKEFRVRGYDYGPTFQGLVDASSDATSAKVKWVGNWVSFTDSMLQLAILGQKKRGLLLPTFIELVKCDIKSLYTEIKRNKNSLGESEVDVFYDKDINIGVSRGIVVKGLKASPAPRRQGAQTATVETYGFLPYNETTFISDSDVKKMEDYTQMCRHLIRKVLDSSYALPEPSDTMKIYIDSSDKKFTLLKLLDETLKDETDTRPALDRLQEKLSNNQSNLSQDIIVSLPITNEKLIRPHIDVILENISVKKLTVTEANTTSALMHPFVTELMAANGVSVNYSFLHPVPDLINKQVGAMKVSSLLSTFPTNIQPDLIVYKDSTTTFLTESDIPEVNEFELQAFLKSTLTTLKEGGFMLLLNRYCISPIEQKLLDVRGLNWPKLRDFDAIKAYAEEIGFVTISEKFDGVSCQSMLLRKPFTKIDEELTVIPIEVKQYNWVNDLKTNLLDKSAEKSGKRVWLVANDSPNNGIVGLVNCLRKEVGGERVRCLFCPSGEGKPGDNLTTEILKKDLVMNIYRNGAYGSFRHFLLDSVEEWAETEHAYLDMKTKGDLSSMRWVEGDHKFWPTLPASAKSPKQILCSTYYSALNFKDVMVATGRIPVDAYPVDYMGTGLIGMEFTGRDQFGNRVMAFTGSKAIASTILLPDPYFIWKIPDMWSMAEACTIPVVYVTVYYALLIRANLRHGESVLIHAGSGGVGQAAIAVCLSMGCNVFTTVGNAAKREFLKKEFPQLEDSHIGNSRDCSFEDMVMFETNGRGVDIVLNSLADEKFKASVRCLADFGRFVEIGKYDIVQNNPISKFLLILEVYFIDKLFPDLSDLGRNKTYHAVCVAHLDYDAIINKSSSALNMGLRVRKMVSDGIESGAVRPLRYHVFEKDQSEEAFRFMATGKHMGKVLIKIREEEPNHVKCLPKPITIKALKQTTFHPLKSYLITGGLGGFGLELADWMITNGAKRIVLSSRSGLKTPFQHLAIRRMKAAGATIVVSNSDVSSFAGAATLVQEAQNLGTLGGIFHLAMVLKDSILENQTVESFEEACASKVQGTLNLDKITRTSCSDLEYFVCFSSVVSGRGNAGQTNYGFANSVMERTCEVRRKDGLPGLAIQWGAIGDVGVVAESMGGNDVVIGGTLPQRIPSCMDVLNQFMQSVHTVCSSIVKADNKRSLGGGKGDLVRTVCHILGVKDPSALDPNTSLGDLGLDSLMAVEIRQGLERDFDIVLSTQEVRALKIKDIQVIGSKTFQQKKQRENNEVKIDESKFSFELPAEMFIRLNSGEHTGRPIFLIPPIEGDFKTLAPIIGHIDRPIIGLNWTVELDGCESIPEVANKYIQFLRETYPDGQYDLVGYSYGSLIAFEICLQLQELLGEKSVKKLLLLDGSPSYLKAFTIEMKSQNNVTEEIEAHIEMLLGFAAMVHPLESSVQNTLRNSLFKLPTTEDRTKAVADYISTVAGVTIDPHVLTSNAERYFKKVKMVHFYEPSDKYSGEIKLVRATETGYSNALTVEIEADYGLNKVCFS